MTLEEVSARLYCSMSKISRIETGRVAATVRDVRDLLDLYSVHGQERERLLALAIEARRKGRWRHVFKGVPDPRAFFELEGFATKISLYESLLVPGLLQTKDYFSLIVASAFPSISSDELERLIELRLLRQSTLVSENAPIVEVVLDEAALHRLVGGSPVMLRQLDYLVERARMPNLTFQVLPFVAGEHGGMVGPFTILDLPDTADPTLVHLEHLAGNLYVERRDLVAAYKLLFRRLQAMALTPEQSVDLLTELAEQLRL
jgi:hypothetical protein